MTDSPYKNRELDNRHQQVMSRLDDIHKQVKKTNGRVDQLENWRSYMLGAIAVLTFLFPVVMTVVIKTLI